MPKFLSESLHAWTGSLAEFLNHVALDSVADSGFVSFNEALYLAFSSPLDEHLFLVFLFRSGRFPLHI